MSPVIRTTERRRSETPAGVMTTLASPTVGDTAGLSMWQVDMTAGASGPLHVFDSEQIWTVLDGELSVPTCAFSCAATQTPSPRSPGNPHHEEPLPGSHDHQPMALRFVIAR
ncbi:hypothetical protein [Nocardia jiangxiensis]|uniref:hypothetical protein n=1 Tax=Nocardia jiangxiensis TaxID=282685 RepID=UPI0012F668D7|nr:hypothetical protein [Nocardia jiangxiensis]